DLRRRLEVEHHAHGAGPPAHAHLAHAVAVELQRRVLQGFGRDRAEEIDERARRAVESMALALEASLLVRFSPAAVADAFVAARLGDDRGFEYGTLPVGTDLQAILARH
ncbi:MAG TPA: hypothetical protein PLC22_19480, partial [Gordonia sp. (in: high G+C Gram-positive bacteria)]|nr:hypothetical protein [Gordonia sp. (in: high G+C Gram-positive bacteria)]